MVTSKSLGSQFHQARNRCERGEGNEVVLGQSHRLHRSLWIKSKRPGRSFGMHSATHLFLLVHLDLHRQTLAIAPRPASPTHELDLPTDTFFANPELARIAKTIASRVNHSPISQPVTSENPDTVILSVHWQPHPLNEAGKKDIWVFKTNRVCSPLPLSFYLLKLCRTTTFATFLRPRLKRLPS